MAEITSVRSPHQAHCKDCSLATLCLPLSLDLQDLDALDSIVKRSRPLKKVNFSFAKGMSLLLFMPCARAALKRLVSLTAEKNKSPAFIYRVSLLDYREWIPNFILYLQLL